MDMGFPREAAVEAMLSTGNVDQAADYLLSMSYNPARAVSFGTIHFSVFDEDEQIRRAIEMSLGPSMAVNFCDVFTLSLKPYIHVRAYDLAYDYPPPNALGVIRSWSSIPPPKVASHTHSILTLPPTDQSHMYAVCPTPYQDMTFQLKSINFITY